MNNMFAVVQKEIDQGDAVLVAVFLIESDAKNWVKVQYEPDAFYVEKFAFDWKYWIEARKTLGIY
jgi:hypothetical protein